MEKELYLTDWRGNDYTVGDHVLYATSSGSTCYMNEGLVLEIIPYEKEKWNYTTKTKDLHLYHKVKVQKVRETGGYDNQPVQTVPLKGTAKASTLTNIGRITKVV
jgi:hypothetical protein